MLAFDQNSKQFAISFTRNIRTFILKAFVWFRTFYLLALHGNPVFDLRTCHNFGTENDQTDQTQTEPVNSFIDIR